MDNQFDKKTPICSQLDKCTPAFSKVFTYILVTKKKKKKNLDYIMNLIDHTLTNFFSRSAICDFISLSLDCSLLEALSASSLAFSAA